MPDTITEDRAELAQEIAELRGKIREAEHEGQIKREAAEQLKASIKAKGLNPITGTSTEDNLAFKEIDEAYKESDGLFDLAATYRRRAESLLEHASSDAVSESDGDPSHP